MNKIVLHTFFLVLASALVLGCAREELPDSRDLDYGYVQFKLYKEASYQTKAGDYDLDYLAQASKINVQLVNESGRTITQTLTLSASDETAAEYGLRSAKLKLLEGVYEMASYTLYDSMDAALGNPVAVSQSFTVTAGGLEVFDLTANVAPRGMIQFNLVKDMDGLTPPTKSAESRDRQYTFDEIEYMDITLINVDNTIERVTFTELPVKFEVYFEGDEHYDGKEGVQGWQTSRSVADTLVYAPAGNYKIYRYQVYDDDKVLLETEDYSSNYADQTAVITVTDNVKTEADVPVTLYEADEYIKDNYALYTIWKSLGGEHWSYAGQSYAMGCNWNFDKDADLWCDQPGVQVHENGRIASIDLSGFGIRGEVPAAIGQLTQLVQLSLGDHNEISRYHETAQTSAYPVSGSAEDRAQWRLNKYKNFGKSVAYAPQMSPVCALALREHGQSSVATTMYDGLTNDEIARMAAGGVTPGALEIRPKDMNHGVLTNGLTKIPEEIRNLTRLESLTIANSPITVDGFPSADAFRQLALVTDFEIYNCPELERIPECVGALPALITVNLSNNEFEPSASKESLQMVATGASEDVIQILYYLQNGLEEFPVEVGEMGSLGMLNVQQNNIKGVLPALGSSFMPEELSFDDNAITGVPDNFCSLEALGSFSISYNELESFPNIFTSDEEAYIMSSINVAHNKIKSLPADFKGVRTVTLTLSANPIETFPKELSATNSYVEQLVMQSCGLKEFPKGCLDGKFTSSLTTFDLQFNNLTDLPEDFSAETLPYLYGMDLSSNSFAKFPYEPLNTLRLTAFSVRGQRDANGNRCLTEWPTGLYTHTGLRGFYIGSNDLGVINDEISYMIYYLDISDNPNIVFDATNVCSYWQAGYYILFYDPDQEIINCDAMLD